MRKIRSTVLILGGILLCLVASLATFFGLSSAGALVEDAINLIYTIQDNEKVYDGEPLVADSYALTEGQLLAGHEAVVTFTGSQTNAGESESGLQVVIVNEEGFDVTSQYTIKVNSGTLTVNPLDVSIHLNDTEVVYDGQRINCNNYTVTEGYLIPGHEFKPSVSVELVNVNDELPQDIDPFIFDAKGNDVTSNYNIDLSFGNITILPRPLIVKPRDVEKQYDGTELICNDYEIVSGSLVAGHFIEATYKTDEGNEASLTEVGTANVKINTIKIYTQVNGEKVDVTQNYELSSSTLSRLEVKPYEVSVSLNNLSKVYDGESILNDLDDAYDVILTHNQLPSGYAFGYIKEKWDAYWEDYVEAQKVLYKDVPFEIFDGNGHNVTNNFVITQIPGTLEITQVTDVVIVLNSYDKIYDGKSIVLSPTTAINLKDSTTLPTGFIYEWVDWVGDIEEYVDAGNYEYSAKFNIVKDGKDLTDKFNVTVMSGKVVINQAELTITAPSDSKEYDGEVLTSNRATPYTSEEVKENIKGTLYGDDAFKLNYEGSLIDVGTTNNIIIDLTFTSGKESNYKINLVDGILKVTEKTVTLKFAFNEYSKTYDGTALTLATSDVNLEGILDSHKVVGIEHTQVIDVNENTADGQVLAIKIVDGKTNVDVTRNYKIDLSATTDFKINKRDITISTPTLTKTYDGTALSDAKAIDVDNRLVSGHVIKLSDNAEISSITNVGNVVNSADYIILDNGRNVTNNYNITYQFGTLTITKREVEITILSNTKQYVGQAYGLNDIKYTHNFPTNLFDVQVATSNITQFVDAGTYDLEATFKVIDVETLNDVTGNFDFIVIPAKFVISPAELTITAPNLTQVYNGEVLTGKKQTPYNSAELAGAIKGTLYGTDSFTLNFDGSIIDTGSTSNVIVDLTFVNGKESNYKITLVDGTLTVTEKEITLIFNQTKYSKTYDGKALELNTSDFTLEGLVAGHQVVNVVYTQVIDVNENTADGKVTSLQIIDSKTNFDVTRNYKINLLATADFEILQRDITIKTPTVSKVYDGKPLSDSKAIDANNRLVLGHEIRVKEGYDIPVISEFGSKQNTIVYNIFENDKDVTNNYRITYLYGTLSIGRDTLNVTIDDLTKVYDGKSFTTSDIKYSRIEDYSLVIATSNITEFKNVGTYEFVVSFKVVDGNGTDVTAYIDLNTNLPKVIIKSQTVNIKVEDLTKDYNGNSFNENDIRFTSDLNSTDFRVVKESSNINNFVDAGTYNLDVEFKVVDMNNLDVSSNFEIIVVPANVIINKAKVNISIEDIEKEYDNNAANEASIEFASNLDSRYYDVIISSSNISKFKNAGTYELDVAFKVLNNNDEDVTSNFEINKNVASLEITRKYISLIFDEDYKVEKYYDGKPLVIDATKLVSEEMLPGHKVVDAKYPTIITSNQLSQNGGLRVSSVTIEDIYGNDVTANYDISYSNAYLSATGGNRRIIIEQIPLIFSADPITINYDPKKGINWEDYLSDYLSYSLISPLASGDSLESCYIYFGEVESRNGFVYVKSIDIFPSILNSNGEYVDGEYYVESITNLPIIINKYNQTISLKDFVFTYEENGDYSFDLDDAIVNYNSIPDELALELELSIQNIYDAGTYSYHVNLNNQDLLNYYDLIILPGNIQVVKKDVQVILKNETVVYSEDCIRDIEGIYDLDNLIVNDVPQEVFDELTLVELSKLNINGAGTYSYYVTVNESLSKNYNISISTGSIVVTKQNVNVVLKNETVVYSEDYMSDIEGIYDLDNLVVNDVPQEVFDGLTLVELSKLNINGAGTYSYYVTINESLSKNYNITISMGTIQVLKKDVYIILKDKTVKYEEDLIDKIREFYDKETLVSVSDSSDDIINGITLPLISELGISGAGTYSYYVNVDSSLYKNYNISVLPGTIYVTKKDVNIILNNKVFKYGEDLTNDIEAFLDIEKMVKTNLPDDVIAGITLPGLSDLNITGAGTYVYYVDVNPNLYNNYNITITAGTIQVTKQDVFIALDNKVIEYSDNYIDEIGAFYAKEILINTTKLPDDVVDGISLEALSSLGINGVGTYSYGLNINDNLYDNYNITVNTGTIQITKKKISVVIKDYAGEYSEEFIDKMDKLEVLDIISGNYTAEELYLFDSLFTVVRPNITTASKYPLTVSVNNISGSENYEITIKPGTIEVYKKDIVISLKSFTAVYDEDGNYYGIPNNPDVDELVLGFNNLDPEIRDALAVASFPSNDELNEAKVYTYKVSIGGIDEKYNVIINEGTIEITKQKYNVYLKEYNISYDRYDTLADYEVDDVVMRYNTIPYDIQQVLVGIDWSDLSNMPGSYTYDLILTNTNLKNYDLIVNTGKVTIDKTEVYVTLYNFEFEYSDDGSSYEYYTTPEDVIVSFESYDPDIQDILSTAVVNYPTLNSVKTYAYDINLSSNNYFNFIVTPGTIKITKKQLNVILNSYSFEYDGDSYLDAIEPEDCVLTDLPDNIMVSSIKCNSQLIEVGLYSYTVNFTGTGLSNYEIMVYPGTIEIYKPVIEKQTIVISLATINATYTGSAINVQTDYDIEDLILNKELLPDDVDVYDFTLASTNYVERGTYSYTIVVPSSISQDYNVQVNIGTLIIA